MLSQNVDHKYGDYFGKMSCFITVDIIVINKRQFLYRIFSQGLVINVSPLSFNGYSHRFILETQVHVFRLEMCQ